MHIFKNIRVFAVCLLLVVVGNALAAPAPPVFLPHITDEGEIYTGPHVIELRPPVGYTIYGGADVSSVRLPDDSICWAATVVLADRSFKLGVFRQFQGDVAIEQPLPRSVVGRGSLSRDRDGVVLTAVDEEGLFRIYVKGCDE